MALKHHKYSFEEQTSQLVTQYGLIPTKNTLSAFIQSCFYDSLNEVYRNFSEEDRKRAYLGLIWGLDDNYSDREKEYYTRFPEPIESSLVKYGIGIIQPETASVFKDLNVSDISIQLLNDYFFEYHLSFEVKSFKANFDAIFNDNLSSKHHQLLTLMDRIEERRLLVNKLTDSELILENINYPKLKDIVDSAQKNLNIFLDNKRSFLEVNMGKSISVHKEGVMPSLRKIIDGDNNLNLYLKYQDYLIQNDYLDGNSLRWIDDDGGKSSFMRFYLKCEEHELIKRGRRSKQIRILSNAYKIDGVVQFDYGPQRCKKALFEKPDEFRDLNIIKSQFNLNS